jgi:chromosome segregation ATPase
MHAILAHFLAVAFTGCTNTKPTAPPPSRPPESAKITPLASKAQRDTYVSRETAGKIETAVEEIQKTTAGLRSGIAAATAEAERLKRQKSATEDELSGLWIILTDEQARSTQLWNQVEESKKATALHLAQLKEAERNLTELAMAANQADAELLTLRLNHDRMSKQIDEARDREADIQAKLSRAEKDAAVARFIKGTAAIGIAVLGIGALCLMVLKLKPI